jgi:hypothetical protein
MPMTVSPAMLELTDDSFGRRTENAVFGEFGISWVFAV